MSDVLFRTLFYALTIYGIIGFLISLIGFLILIVDKENRRDMTRYGLLHTLFSFIRIALEWPLIVQDAIETRQSVRRVKRGLDKIMNELEKDIEDSNAEESKDRRGH